MQKNHALIITEKPSAAKRIAEALDSKHTPKENTDGGVPYYTVRRDRDIIVVPALGHLYTVAEEKKEKGNYPFFNYKWVPRNLADKKAKHIRKIIDVISKLAKNADTFIDACDYDIEGSLIGYNILKHACTDKENQAHRMKYTTLTQDELETSYSKLQPRLDFRLIEAGMTRHEVDWLYGINLTRALTIAAKRATGRYSALSVGRVQGPTLRFVVQREEHIRTHVPVPYWQLQAKLQIGKQTLWAQYENAKIEIRKEAQQILDECTGKAGQITNINTQLLRQVPPVPFDLGTLQAESYRVFGYTPYRTLQIAQRLYVDAAVSYPRTSSQKLPSSIGYSSILRSIADIPRYSDMTRELLCKPTLIPRQGMKKDSAHPAIYPTGNFPNGSTNQENKLFDLIVRRFLAAFGNPAIKEKIVITLTIGKHTFYLKGEQAVKQGWMRYYQPYCKIDGYLLPKMQKGDRITFDQLSMEDMFTYPRSRYNPSTLLEQMEKTGIGTKATRAQVIETLFKRRYIQNENITTTAVGLAVMATLETYSPRIISSRMTRQLERRMMEIQKGLGTRQGVIKETIAVLEPTLDRIKQNEGPIGTNLGEALNVSHSEQATIGKCRKCGTGRLIVIRSRKTGKRFIGCTNYFLGECRATFPLPQNGTIRSTNRTCKACGWPIIAVLTFRRRPWNICINPGCQTKKQGKKQK